MPRCKIWGLHGVLSISLGLYYYKNITVLSFYSNYSFLKDCWIYIFSDFRTCTVIGDYGDSISDLKEWSESHEGKILVTNPSTYLTGASFAVYEGIGNEEKVHVEYFYHY